MEKEENEEVEEKEEEDEVQVQVIPGEDTKSFEDRMLNVINASCDSLSFFKES